MHGSMPYGRYKVCNIDRKGICLWEDMQLMTA